MIHNYMKVSIHQSGNTFMVILSNKLFTLVMIFFYSCSSYYLMYDFDEHLVKHQHILT